MNQRIQNDLQKQNKKTLLVTYIAKMRFSKLIKVDIKLTLKFNPTIKIKVKI